MRNDFVKEILASKDPHQTVLDIAYTVWQDESNKDVTCYADVVDYAYSHIGGIGALAILVGKYNQQVENGGHMQYFGNGYASRGSDGFGSHDDAELHMEMLELMRKFDFQEEPVYKIMFNVMFMQEECEDCGGMGTYEEEDYDEELDHVEYYEETCYSCNGSGESDGLGCSGDDSGYYDVNEKWLKNFAVELVKVLKESN